MGLLGGFFSDPEQMGLLGLSSGLLQAGGPQRLPIGLGGALAQGLQTGAQAAQQTQALNDQRNLHGLQARALELSNASTERQQGALDSFSQTLKPEERPLFLANPAAYLKRITENPFAKVNPQDYTPESVRQFTQTRNFADLVPARKREVAPSGQVYDPYTVMPGSNLGDPSKLVMIGPDGKPAVNQLAVAARAQVAAAGKPETSVNIKQETAESQAIGRELGQQYVTLQKSGQDALAKLARLDRMEALMQGVNTGKLAPAMTEVSALAQSLGIKVDPKLGAKQALEALSNEMALTLRNPSGGAGMPGALSDKDRDFLKAMAPGLAKTPEGNRLIIDTARKLAIRDQEMATLARQYRLDHGTLDGFSDYAKKYADAHPLFDDSSVAGGKQVAPDGIDPKLWAVMTPQERSLWQK